MLERPRPRPRPWFRCCLCLCLPTLRVSGRRHSPRKTQVGNYRVKNTFVSP